MPEVPADPAPLLNPAAPPLPLLPVKLAYKPAGAAVDPFLALGPVLPVVFVIAPPVAVPPRPPPTRVPLMPPFEVIVVIVIVPLTTVLATPLTAAVTPTPPLPPSPTVYVSVCPG